MKRSRSVSMLAVAAAALLTALLSSLVVGATPAHAQGLGELVSPGPLAQPHAALDRLDKCAECHAMGKGVPDQRCLACHQALAQRVAAKRGFHAQVNGTCISCHADHRGTAFDMVQFDTRRFDHGKSGWALEGAHRKTPCARCHTASVAKALGIRGETYLGLDTACTSCHENVHGTQFVDAATGEPPACTSCHSLDGWRPARIDHQKTRFPLDGKHVNVACAKCHENGRFAGTPLACASCHEDVHHGQFRDARGAPQACSSCHTAASWKTTRIDHDRTRFPLVGKHLGVACAKCHSNGRFADTPTDCASCHVDVHKGQFKLSSGAPKPCADCHDASSWSREKIDHDRTRFPLRNAHARVDCAKCHDQGRFKDTPLACASCHDDVHEGQFREPSGAATACASCHADQGWKPARVDHQKSRFPLTGKHVDVACAKCHDQGRFKPLELACASCHADPHRGDQGANCTACHSTSSWKSLVGREHTERFPLLGMHAATPCASCHVKADQFVEHDPSWGNPNDCVGCHVDPHRGQFDRTCAECHSPSAWQPVKFRHEDTAFVLTGAHRAAGCGDCHKSRSYRDTPSACVACHEKDFAAATRFDHRASAAIECQDCHSQVAWLPAKVDHDSFPLRGGHAVPTCEDCHKTKPFGAIDTACASCHLADFTRAPQHLALGLPPSLCDQCHSVTTFARHEPRLPIDCFTCHRNQYLATRDPNHVEKGFSTDCQDCHGTATWDDARGDRRGRVRSGGRNGGHGGGKH